MIGPFGTVSIFLACRDAFPVLKQSINTAIGASDRIVELLDPAL
jgi:hypothetical protein